MNNMNRRKFMDVAGVGLLAGTASAQMEESGSVEDKMKTERGKKKLPAHIQKAVVRHKKQKKEEHPQLASARYLRQEKQ